MKLIFVYNVDASPVALLRDLYQIVAVGETDCRLCDLSYGKLLKDPRWTRFVRSLPCPVEFRLRSTFVRRHPELRDRAFPAAFVSNDDGISELIDAAAFNALPDLPALISLVEERVDRLLAERGRP